MFEVFGVPLKLVNGHGILLRCKNYPKNSHKRFTVALTPERTTRSVG